MAVRARALLAKWQHIVLYRHKSFPLFTLAKARLDAYYWNGLGETFNLPAHVQQAVQGCD
jgi:hypothetical protein